MDKRLKLIGVMGIIFMTFGITYFDIEDLSMANNLKPYTMLVLGIVTIVYFISGKRKTE